MWIALAFLFVLQIIGFLIMTLFYLKFSKFQALEKKQQKLIIEMEQSAAAFIAEIKEENDRLISQIERREAIEAKKQQPAQEKPLKPKLAEREETFEKLVSPLPVQVALRNYQKNTQPAAKEVKQTAELAAAVTSDFQTAKKLYGEGKSIEEIAKLLGKGRTEIELLLKFG